MGKCWSMQWKQKKSIVVPTNKTKGMNYDLTVCMTATEMMQHRWTVQLSDGTYLKTCELSEVAHRGPKMRMFLKDTNAVTTSDIPVAWSVVCENKPSWNAGSCMRDNILITTDESYLNATNNLVCYGEFLLPNESAVTNESGKSNVSNRWYKNTLKYSNCFNALLDIVDESLDEVETYLVFLKKIE